MTWLLVLLTFLLSVTAVLLVTVIMLQGPQDDGSGAMAAYNPNMKALGAIRAPNLFEQVTRFLAGLLLVLILGTSYVIKRRYDAKHRASETMEQVKTYMITEDGDKEKA